MQEGDLGKLPSVYSTIDAISKSQVTKKAKVFDRMDLEKLVQSVNLGSYGQVVLLVLAICGFSTGMRLNELRNLNWEDISEVRDQDGTPSKVKIIIRKSKTDPAGKVQPVYVFLGYFLVNNI